MIPVKLELHNFLAYRTPDPLDLSGIHMACLAGANGAGKSSLLDAMTWALWGKARAHSDNELIHGNEIEMQVGLTFALEGNLYRATRYRSRKGAGSSQLILEVQDGENWRSLTESTIRATQDRITGILRLDYATFINSAFLVQGRADEFTRKTPGERKAILTDILGLDRWAVYEERARQRIRQAEQEQGQIDAQMSESDAELSREGEYKDALIAAQQQLDTLRRQVQDMEARHYQLQEARNQLQAVRRRAGDLRNRLQQGELELGHLSAERDQNQQRLAGLQQILASREDIETGHQAWLDARRQERDMNVRLLEQSNLIQRQSALRETIGAARAGLTARQEALAQRMQSVEQAAAESINQEALRTSESEVAVLEKQEAEVAARRELLAARRAEQVRLEDRLHSLHNEQTQEAFLLEQIISGEQATCPLCGQTLSETHRSDLIAALEKKAQTKQDELQTIHQQVEMIKNEAVRLNREIKQAEPDLKRLHPRREHVARLKERMSRAGEMQADLEALQADLALVTQTLAESAYTQPEQTELADLITRLADLGYDETEHQAIQATIARYEGYESRRSDLERALEDVPNLEQTIARLTERITAWEENLFGDRTVLAEAEEEMRDLEQQGVGFEQVERDLNNLRDQEGDARAGVGAAEQKIRALDDLRRRREELAQRRESLAQEQGMYEDLRLAFGKDGIPAMIIEVAIPEIEEGANQILARMTDGRMRLRFDTQREKVTGGIRETLDINIADELGVRDYATFSGGEAFRVNFAIRLALSRLLARRAGAKLRTLIIDEGFGTQDAQGRERLVQALNGIQDEFDLILVITHIDDLKDAFPVRIEVTKTPYGSQIELV